MKSPPVLRRMMSMLARFELRVMVNSFLRLLSLAALRSMAKPYDRNLYLNMRPVLLLTFERMASCTPSKSKLSHSHEEVFCSCMAAS